MNTVKQDYIIDHTGAENWQEIVDAYGHLTSVAKIKVELDRIFPTEDNQMLAEMICEEL